MRIVAGFVARPDDRSWMDAITGVARAILHLRTECDRLGLVKAKDADHRRGKFLALASGISFGGGQTVRSYSTPSHLDAQLTPR